MNKIRYYKKQLNLANAVYIRFTKPITQETYDSIIAWFFEALVYYNEKLIKKEAN